MTSTRHKHFDYNIIIKSMQGDKKILYEAVGRVLRKRRLDLGEKLTLFCYENDIPTTTLTSIEAARTEACFYNIFKVCRALELSMDEFGKLLEKGLPENFLNKEE